MSVASATAAALMFLWVGMVAAISFLEAPLKFRAPGVTLPIGLGIGRLVFGALNAVEAVLAVIVIAAVILDPPPPAAIVAVGVAASALVVQLAVVRPRLRRRSNMVLAERTRAAGTTSRSRTHYAYTALEIVKMVGLIVGGIVLLTG